VYLFLTSMYQAFVPKPPDISALNVQMKRTAVIQCEVTGPKCCYVNVTSWCCATAWF